MTRKTIALLIAAATIVLLAALAAWRIEIVSSRMLAARHPLPARPLGVPVLPGDAAEGLRLAHLNGCFACHGAQLNGRVMSRGVFGSRLTAPNLTRTTAHMSDDQIAAAIRYGVRPDGTALFEMPSADFIALSGSDTAAIIAYLRTLAPKPDAAEKTQWNFDARLLLAMGFIRNEAQAVDPSSRGPERTPKDAPALGRYLTQAQCTACHGPDLGGDPQLHSPDLRATARHYTFAQFQHFFATGQARKGHDAKIMSHAIDTALKYLKPAETAAIYAYLTAPQSGGGGQRAH